VLPALRRGFYAPNPLDTNNPEAIQVAASDVRVFLFLQGPPSSFAKLLANEIDRRGHRVLRINLCTGDALSWIGRRAFNYRGRLKDWPRYLEDFIDREGVTDIVYYADRVPYHRVAAAIARRKGIRATTYENGYLRPDWVTLERNGMSAHSHFPDDPETIMKIAEGQARPNTHTVYPFPFVLEAFHEVFYALTTYFLWFLYPHYNADRYYDPIVNYLYFLRKQFRSGKADKKAHRLNERLAVREIPFFLVPLQLQHDYQLSANSTYPHQRVMIEEVVQSFAKHADEETHLVFKLHPYDSGIENFPKVVRIAARRAGIQKRVHVNEGGTLGTLLRITKGAVLINSTVGVTAIVLNVPVKVLGYSLYDIKGLTHEGSLDSFWNEPQKPDRTLRDAFLAAVAATIQVKGNFFTKEGRAAAIPEIASRLIEDRVNEPGAYTDPPPRLARAHAAGVPYCTDEDVLANLEDNVRASPGPGSQAVPATAPKSGPGDMSV